MKFGNLEILLSGVPEDDRIWYARQTREVRQDSIVHAFGGCVAALRLHNADQRELGGDPSEPSSCVLWSVPVSRLPWRQFSEMEEVV